MVFRELIMANLINGLGGTAGFGENQLTRNDDSYASNIDITSVFGASGLNFFGTNYTSISVNNNGNITLGGSGQSTYTPYGMQSSTRAMIAPFFADVDTRGNTVAATTGGTSQGSNLTYYDLNTSGNGSLTVTWDDVGYYSSRTDKINAFQLQLIGKGNGNFDIVFRYEAVNWTTGNASGGSGGLGGTVARAGYSTGDGTSWYELSQSGSQSAMLDLETTTGNTGVAGYYKFSITNGTAGDDNLRGTSGNDSLYGSTGNDVIYGLGGNDVLYGAGGTDILHGGLGDDTYIIDEYDTVIESASQGTDTVQTSISYTLSANVENLILTGSNSINATGNASNNTLIGNSGANIFNGAGGTDIVSYELSRYGVTADLSNTASQYTGQGYDTFISIEGLTGTDDNDTLTGNTVANILNGGGGNDTLNGGAGNDTLNGGLGNDVMNGGDGSDRYYVDSISDSVVESNAVLSTGGNDTVFSYLSDYTLGANVENGRIMLAGAANLTGNSLANVLYAGAGDNVLIGGAGTDTVSYQYATSAVAVDLSKTVAQATIGSGTDRLDSIERLIGSNYNDKLTGNAAANTLTGGNGNDTLNGATGNDALIGGAGNDVLNGGVGVDAMTGGDGSDSYYVDNIGDRVTETNAVLATGGNDIVYSYLNAYTLGANVENGRVMLTTAANLTGNNLGNVLYAGTGNNKLDGGAGADTASYQYATSAVTVNLGNTGNQVTGGSGTDQLISIEHLIGSNFNDTLTGNSAGNVLSAGNGNDTLNGGAGNDRLTGGLGKDVLVGGAGKDVFDFNSLAEMGLTTATRDIIRDFTRGQDKIDLSTFDANTATSTNDAFTSIIGSNAAFTAAGQLKLLDGVLYGNTDADSTAEFSIQLVGVTSLNLQQDFIA
jgi:Ca2+-binding RTX toxin-like protein